jgi:hypothetical protein
LLLFNAQKDFFAESDNGVDRLDDMFLVTAKYYVFYKLIEPRGHLLMIITNREASPLGQIRFALSKISNDYFPPLNE